MRGVQPEISEFFISCAGARWRTGGRSAKLDALAGDHAIGKVCLERQGLGGSKLGRSRLHPPNLTKSSRECDAHCRQASGGVAWRRVNMHAGEDSPRSF